MLDRVIQFRVAVAWQLPRGARARTTRSHVVLLMHSQRELQLQYATHEPSTSRTKTSRHPLKVFSFKQSPNSNLFISRICIHQPDCHAIMYELYLTATVSDAELDATCEILSGLCGMKPWNSLTRQLFFQGSVPPTGFSNMRSIEKPMRKEVGLMWKELHQSLSRQPFILQARYDVQQDRDMGSDAAPMALDERQGILRWSDIPDPSHGRPQVTQSKVVELWEQRNIVSVLTDNNFKCVNPMSYFLCRP